MLLTITFDPKDYPTPKDFASDAEDLVWSLSYQGEKWGDVDRSGEFSGMSGTLKYTIEEKTP